MSEQRSPECVTHCHKVSPARLPFIVSVLYQQTAEEVVLFHSGCSYTVLGLLAASLSPNLMYHITECCDNCETKVYEPVLKLYSTSKSWYKKFNDENHFSWSN
jgi:hypothetical protein